MFWYIWHWDNPTNILELKQCNYYIDIYFLIIVSVNNDALFESIGLSTAIGSVLILDRISTISLRVWTSLQQSRCHFVILNFGISHRCFLSSLAQRCCSKCCSNENSDVITTKSHPLYFPTNSMLMLYIL